MMYVSQNPAPTLLKSSSHGEDTNDHHRDYSAFACQPKMKIGKVLRGWACVLDRAMKYPSSSFHVIHFTHLLGHSAGIIV